MKIVLSRFLLVCFLTFFLWEGLSDVSAVKEQSASSLKKTKSYSFRPLLIQGKKQVNQQADMKVESGSIVESQLFFVDIDFKKRIFESEFKE